ncbi:MAG: phosphoglycerate dehydrogenase [Clostridia bacterium]|nr:phosphoglycerate dehydrogenase [Clostridia bacterium]
MYKVLVADPVSEQGLKIIEDLGNVEIDVKLKLSEDEIAEIIGDYHAMIVRSGVKVTKKIIDNAHKMKIIGRAGVGVDNIDVEAATAKGILVVNAPEGNTIAACELSIGAMFALARNIPQAHSDLVKGDWERKKYMGIELRGKTLGVVGLGKIGSEVAKRANAMEMKVIGYDPFVTEERAKRMGVELADLETIYRESDFITLHLPLTDKTRNMIGHEEFKMMKKDARIINVARGGIINEKALYEALTTGEIGGAALDVFEVEPTTDSPLFQLNSCIVTPHLGASTIEAQENVAIDVANDIKRVLSGEMVKNAVNIPVVKPELTEIFAPYLELMEQMGKFISQLTHSPLKKLEVKYSGELAQYDTGSLTNTVLKGVLKPVLDDTVNYINAPHVAKSRGIAVHESKTVEVEDYVNLITVEITTEAGKRTVSGTLFKKNEPRIVAIDDYDIDLVLHGHLLVVPHTDQPGIIGKVGTLIGMEDVNIGEMRVGRKRQGGEAVMVLLIDNAVSDFTIAEIREINGIHEVQYVKL